jgi:hypothetical protein
MMESISWKGWYRVRALCAAMLPCLLAACAGMSGGQPGILIETAAAGQPLPGVACVAMIDSTRWDVVTPAVITLGSANGVLRIVCNHPGFRTSELIFKPAPMSTPGLSAAYGSYSSHAALEAAFPVGGVGSRYPERLVLDLNRP